MNPIIQEFQKKSDDAILRLKDELKSIRTNRISPAFIEDLMIPVYGGQSKLKLLELATITTEGASQLIVAPFDSLTIQDIEKAILSSPLSLSPITQGTRIIIRIPPLSHEQRTKLSKLTNQMTEESKEVIRGYRDDAIKKLKQQGEAAEITKDDRFKAEKDLDSATTNLMTTLKTIKEHKEKEIMVV